MASISHRSLGRWLVLVILAGLSLELFFAARIALMAVVDPQSTAFQRSEMARLLRTQGQILWAQQWQDDAQISRQIKRAVIASEDAGFADHNGVEWDALENAWRRNTAAKERADKHTQRAQERHARAVARALKRGRPVPEAPSTLNTMPKVIGGSTITQQLAKNLLLSSERNFLRKGQEFALTFMLEACLSKERILAIYLNNVEWGEGVFGIQAASRHYFQADASQLTPSQAARLAVMLPAPKRFEKNTNSGYVSARARSIVHRMGNVELP
jgi:monofunctional biosynthetic peptidoglycan transglycosylase